MKITDPSIRGIGSLQIDWPKSILLRDGIYLVGSFASLGRVPVVLIMKIREHGRFSSRSSYEVNFGAEKKYL